MCGWNSACLYLFPPAACDSCVIVLLEDLDKMNDNFSSVASQLSNLNASSMAWAQLHSLNKSVEDIAVSCTQTQHRHTSEGLFHINRLCVFALVWGCLWVGQGATGLWWFVLYLTVGKEARWSHLRAWDHFFDLVVSEWCLLSPLQWKEERFFLFLWPLAGWCSFVRFFLWAQAWRVGLQIQLNAPILFILLDRMCKLAEGVCQQILMGISGVWGVFTKVM